MRACVRVCVRACVCVCVLFSFVCCCWVSGFVVVVVGFCGCFVGGGDEGVAAVLCNEIISFLYIAASHTHVHYFLVYICHIFTLFS